MEADCAVPCKEALHGVHSRRRSPTGVLGGLPGSEERRAECTEPSRACG